MAHTIVIFGASGDLTSRKLIPALYELHRKKRLPAGHCGSSASRGPSSRHDAWREKLAGSTAEFVGKDFDAAAWRAFAPSIYYHPGDVGNPADFPPLADFLTELEGRQEATRVYHLSIAPQLYAPVIAQLGAAGLAREDRGPRRVVIEKPFGTDLDSARLLNQQVHEVFAEHQVYRIDHYLGKETVQNVLVLRFANAVFEPIWNRNYIEHVQITAAEDLTVGPSRGVLRLGGHSAGHVPEPPAATDDLYGDGGPRPLRGRGRPRREGEGAPLDPHDEARGGVHRHGPRPVPQVPGRAGRAGRTARRPPSARSSCTSRTGAGRACRSSSAAARPCPAAPPRS